MCIRDSLSSLCFTCDNNSDAHARVCVCQCVHTWQWEKETGMSDERKETEDRKEELCETCRHVFCFIFSIWWLRRQKHSACRPICTSKPDTTPKLQLFQNERALTIQMLREYRFVCTINQSRMKKKKKTKRFNSFLNVLRNISLLFTNEVLSKFSVTGCSFTTITNREITIF